MTMSRMLIENMCNTLIINGHFQFSDFQRRNISFHINAFLDNRFLDQKILRGTIVNRLKIEHTNIF